MHGSTDITNRGDIQLYILEYDTLNVGTTSGGIVKVVEWYYVSISQLERK